MMRVSTWLSIILGTVVASSTVLAANTIESGKGCSPTNISYCPKQGGSTLFGGKYTTYTVRCSDGTQRTITHWQKDKSWCVGRDGNCTNGQLQAAKLACLQ